MGGDASRNGAELFETEADFSAKIVTFRLVGGMHPPHPPPLNPPLRVAFHRSPRKSIRVASNELAIPRSTVHKVLHKRLRLHAYKLQIVQALKPDDRPRRAAFAEEILQRIDDDNGYLNSVCFSDEATFHVSGKVNKHNIRIWGSQNPCEVLERERDSPKINVWCGLMHNQIIGPFIFAESTITANI